MFQASYSQYADTYHKVDAIITVIKKSIAQNKACNFINSVILMSWKISIQEEKPSYFESRNHTKKFHCQF